MAEHIPGAVSADLLTPSLQDAEVAYTAKPWRLTSQFWVAFFGGALAITAIAYLNGKRLRLPRAELNKIILVGVVAIALTVGIAFVVGANMTADSAGEISRGSRLAIRVISIVAYFVLRKIQEPADLRYQFFGGEAYSSLWKAGLLATFGLGTLQALLLLIILGVALF